MEEGAGSAAERLAEAMDGVARTLREFVQASGEAARAQIGGAVAAVAQAGEEAATRLQASIKASGARLVQAVEGTAGRLEGAAARFEAASEATGRAGPPSPGRARACRRRRSVLVEGHTDRRPLTPGPDLRNNYQLSAGRALTVYRAIVGSQPSLLALRNVEEQPLLGVSGYGETRPLPTAQGDTERDYAANRRIDIRFILTARTADEIDRLRGEIRAVLGSGR